MKERKKRKKSVKKPSRFRLILTTAGVVFVSFNIFLITRIKSDVTNAQLPHHEIDYEKIQNFTINVNHRIREPLSSLSTPSLVESIAVSSSDGLPDPKPSDAVTFANIPRVKVSSTMGVTLQSFPESFDEKREKNIVNEKVEEVVKVEEEEKVDDVKQAQNQMKINPLLWQLHQQNNKKGGIQNTGQLLDRHRFMMREDTNDAIPKRYSENVTIEDVSYVTQPSVDCAKKDLVVFVKSRVESFGLRDLIRSTWSAQDYIGDSSVAVLFLVGKSDSTYLNRQLQNEGRDKQDVLVGEFIDSYQNLTLKTISGIQWFVNECSSSQYYMSVDDDVYPNLQVVLQYLQKAENQNVELGCLFNYVPHAKVTRNGKWKTPWLSYGKEFYPAYCEGACYTMAAATAKRMYQFAQVTRRDAPVDDAYLTGVLREKASIIPTQVNNKNMCNHLVNDDGIIQKLKTIWESSK